jgi:hypothetical protein
MPREDLTGKEIICRLDKVVLFIKRTPGNLERHKGIWEELVWAFTDLFREPSIGRTIDGRKMMTFGHEDERLFLIFPDRKRNHNELMRICIINDAKWDFDLHQGYIRAVGDILDIHHIDYGLSKAEIALDTIDVTTGQQIAQCAKLKWGRTDSLINYEKGKYQTGGSTTGKNEYMQNWKSPRQTYCYERISTVPDWAGGEREEIIHRFELRMGRKYLRRQEIETVDDLFKKVPELVKKSLTYNFLDFPKLKREFPKARNWRLKGYSIPEQCRRLQNNGLRKEAIRKYFKKLTPPKIVYAFDDIPDKSRGNIEYALFRGMHSLLQGGTNSV